LAVPEGGYGEDEDVANAEDEAYLEVRERSDRGSIGIDRGLDRDR
jgi:hypothetical protein